MSDCCSAKCDYAEFVASRCKPGTDILAYTTPTEIELLHMAVGVSGEAGELLDAVKKHVIYGKPLDITNVVEELGDLEFYMQGLRNILGVSRQEIVDLNKAKLSVRYQNGYTDNEASLRRDKAD